MKVWVVDAGKYSDKRLIGIFSTKEKALLAVKACEGRFPYSDDTYNDCNEPYEVEVDRDSVFMEQGLSPWDVDMFFDGEHANANPQPMSDMHGFRVFNTSKRSIAMSVWARDAEHAIKIVNERRIIWRAEEGV